MPLLVGIALLSMAAGARHGFPASTTAATSASSASVLSVPADLPTQDAAVPAGFVVDLADARDVVPSAAIEGIDAEPDRWGIGHAAPVTAVAAAPIREEPQAPPQPQIQLTALRASVPATLGSRAPPTA